MRPAASLKLVDTRYWTSGTSEGHGCLKNYGWCSTAKMFSGIAANFSQWDGGKPSNVYDERCVQLKLDSDPKKMLFEDLACTENRFVLCEVIQFSLLEFALIQTRFLKGSYSKARLYLPSIR
jgi:hypothetical protein